MDSYYSDEIIAYMSEAIVHYLKWCIHYHSCLNIIDGLKHCSDKPALISLKNRGGLNFSADFVIVICKLTERVIREQKNLFAKNIFEIVTHNTLRRLPTNILDNQNFLDQDPLLNHRNQLLMLIIKKYINMRFVHESHLLNDKINRIKIKNNEITIFSGQ